MMKVSNFSNILENGAFHKSVIGAAAETVMFVHNIINLSFEELLLSIPVSSFDFWKIINSFLRFDPMVTQTN